MQDFKLMTKEEYKKYIEDTNPKSPILKNTLFAFLVGGLICCVGEAVSIFLKRYNLTKEMVSNLVTMFLIALSCILTGFKIYSKIGKVAGAGSIVPITGFANSVVSPAIEFKSEGYIFGVGSKIFTIAGPVILYGTISSVIIGTIYYILKMFFI